MRQIIAGLLIAFLATAACAQEAGIGIAAVVDDQVISTVDVNDRLALVMGMTNITDTPENRARLTSQILRQLIEEKLQLAEAARDGITITDPKLREGIAQIEKQNGKAPGSLVGFVESKHLSTLSLYSQVRAQMAWSEVILKKLRPKIKISEREVATHTQRKPAASSSPDAHTGEVLIAAIHMPVDTPKDEANTRKLADKLASDIRAGASFEAMASQFSSSVSGTKATDPFWVDLAQIDPAIAHALTNVAKGGITDPVRTAAGYQIIKLVDERHSAPPVAATTPASDEPRAELAFKQILMTLKPDAKPKEADLLLQLAKEVQKSPGKCGDKSMAGAGNLGDMDFRITLTRAVSSDLPEKLRDFMMKLNVGDVSDPVVTPQGIRLFMLCERIDLPAAKLTQAENDDAIRQAIYTEKLELEAQKFLRDLRREAFIEIRTH